ncbi:C-type lectin domain family 4 member A-like isoform X2 [Anarhichas minor]|uniref:C-type lectin domain family 4 member A-like isoform X2 n=1 Tax=Anarhichas minor TaxID=65739 RepID=UPI003F741BD8
MASSTAMEELHVHEYDEPDDSSPSTNGTGPRSSKLKSRSDGAVFLSLGLLSVFLLARLISFFVYYRASEDKLSSVSEERDLLNASLTHLIEEMDRRQRWCNQKKMCPEGWRRFSSSCYLLSNKTGSWEESRKDCRDKGADLVIIDSLEEQKLLLNIITDHTWIGLSDRDDEGTWRWIDGTPLTEALCCRADLLWNRWHPRERWRNYTSMNMMNLTTRALPPMGQVPGAQS